MKFKEGLTCMVLQCLTCLALVRALVHVCEGEKPAGGTRSAPVPFEFPPAKQSLGGGPSAGSVCISRRV